MYYENARGKVYYEVHGPKDAPVLAFSHGICMDHQTFLPQLDAFRDRYRVLLWDMPFHGLSSAMDQDLQFTSTAADFLVGIMESLDVKEGALLVGQSLGSFVTQQAACRYPDRIRATAHVGGASLYPGGGWPYKMMGPFFSAFISLYPERSMFKAFARHRALQPETKAYLEEVSSRTGKRVMAHITGQLLKDIARGLPRPPAEPKLLCHGDHESGLVKRLLGRWHRSAPESRLEVIEDAHHIANQDNPEAFNRVLSSFLAGE